MLENTLIRIRTKICVLRIFFAYACHLRIFLICWYNIRVPRRSLSDHSTIVPIDDGNDNDDIDGEEYAMQMLLGLANYRERLKLSSLSSPENVLFFIDKNVGIFSLYWLLHTNYWIANSKRYSIIISLYWLLHIKNFCKIFYK